MKRERERERERERFTCLEDDLGGSRVGERVRGLSSGGGHLGSGGLDGQGGHSEEVEEDGELFSRDEICLSPLDSSYL